MAISICAGAVWADDHPAGEGLLTIHGKIQDDTGNPIADARVDLFQGGKPYELHKGDVVGHGKENVTGSNGLFSLAIHAPVEEIKKGNWAVKIAKPSFKTTDLIPLSTIADLGKNSDGIPQMTASLNVTLDRYQGAAFWLAHSRWGIYVLISLELVHRTLAAMLGAAAILGITHTFGHFNQAYEILTFERALRVVDWNVIFLLMGMMVMVGVLKESGVFQWMAYKSFQLTRGRIFLLAAALCVVTAVLSAFLDNVTTMLLLTPVTIEIALVLGISPFAFLVPEIMASNFGGTATLIGDPPNIMIGSVRGADVQRFRPDAYAVVIVTMVVQVLYTKWCLRP